MEFHRSTEQILLGNQVQLYQVILGVNFGYLFCTRGESDLAPGPTPYAVGGETVLTPPTPAIPP